MSVQDFSPRAIVPSVLSYVEGWSSRRADWVVEAMAEEGIYVDHPHPIIKKNHMKAHLECVAWVNFPDMSFDTLNVFGGNGLYAWEWALNASSCGVVVQSRSVRNIYCEGVDILTLDSAGKIIKAVCHIDRKALWDSVVG
jgi:hypothetical protein